MLTNRQFQILETLLNANSYILINDLAHQFSVSERTIQYDIEYLEFMKDKLNIEIIRSRVDGVKINKLSSQFMNLELFNLPSVHLNKQERKVNLLLYLFETDKPITSKTLSDLVNVSRRTIANDIKGLEEWLNCNNLKLVYVKNKGFLIKGEEEKYRRAYGEIINEYRTIMNKIVRREFFSDDDLIKIRNIVLEALKKHNYSLVQISIDGLITHLLIAIERVKNNFTISSSRIEKNDEIIKSKQYKVANEIRNNIEQQLNINIPNPEVAFITLHLLTAKKVYADKQFEDSEDLQILIHQFVEKITSLLGIDFLNDNNLINNLYIHLVPAIHRLSYGITQENPLQEEISSQYPELLTAISKNIWIFEEIYSIKFTTDEISYLAIHLASSYEKISQRINSIKVILLCGSGIGTSQLLKSKITRIYPEFEIIDAYSLYQINEMELNKLEIDYIISTVPTNFKTIPTVIVSPFLIHEDRKELNKLIDLEREKRINIIGEKSVSLKQSLPLRRMLKVKGNYSMNEAIKMTIELLEKDNIVNNKYSDEIIEKINDLGPYMVISPHLALIHGDTKNVLNKVGYSVIYFENGILFNKKDYDPIKVIFGLATSNPKIHLKSLEELHNFLSIESNMNELLKGNLEVLKKFLN